VFDDQDVDPAHPISTSDTDPRVDASSTNLVRGRRSSGQA